MTRLRWEELPENLRNPAVRPYYDILRRKRVSLILKRIFDIAVSLVMIVILSPVFVLLALWIKLDSPGPVFYRQVRVTSCNRDFRIFKFRTMVQDADKRGNLVTGANDARITRAGSKLRKLRIDELPQLFNILAGDMSFVGTRPEVRKYVDRYTDEMMATLLLPAGVTSLASISFKDEDVLLDKYTEEGMSVDEAYTEKILPQKMKYNLEYIGKTNLHYDIALMLKTVIGVIK